MILKTRTQLIETIRLQLNFQRTRSRKINTITINRQIYFVNDVK